jgi:hypothetical protein
MVGASHTTVARGSDPMTEATIQSTVVWTELRDERGKLCARIDGRLLLLEVRRNGETVIFDLREYMVELKVVGVQSEA